MKIPTPGSTIPIADLSDFPEMTPEQLSQRLYKLRNQLHTKVTLLRQERHLDLQQQSQHCFHTAQQEFPELTSECVHKLARHAEYSTFYKINETEIKQALQDHGKKWWRTPHGYSSALEHQHILFKIWLAAHGQDLPNVAFRESLEQCQHTLKHYEGLLAKMEGLLHILNRREPTEVIRPSIPQSEHAYSKSILSTVHPKTPEHLLITQSDSMDDLLIYWLTNIPTSSRTLLYDAILTVEEPINTEYSIISSSPIFTNGSETLPLSSTGSAVFLEETILTGAHEMPHSVLNDSLFPNAPDTFNYQEQDTGRFS